MSENSRIEWTDTTWNPVTGCTRESEGCDNCYAVRMTKRLALMGQEKYSGLVNIGKNHFNGTVKCHEDELLKPLSWKKPRRVFVCSMSDLFHQHVPFEFVDKVFAVMALTPHITYQLLTKRPERMAEYTKQLGRHWQSDRVSMAVRAISDGYGFTWNAVPGGWALPNVMLGTTVENQEQAEKRIPHLQRCPAAVRYLSVEPMLGAVDAHVHFGNILDVGDGWERGYTDGRKSEIHWVICGGESGPNARPMNPEWARSLRDQCVAAGVPFFFKQGSQANWLNFKDFESFPVDLQIREFPDAEEPIYSPQELEAAGQAGLF